MIHPGVDHIPRSPKRETSFFEWFPWEKLTIWGLFLLLVYALREFFTVIFLTFLFSYIMTNVVRSIMRVISPGQERLWLHRICVLVAFVLLLSSLTGVVLFLKNPFEDQVSSLKRQFRNFDLKTLLDDVTGNTIGSWQFDRLYKGSPEAEALYNSDLEKYRQEEFIRRETEQFRQLEAKILKDFEDAVKEKSGETRYNELVKEGRHDLEFENWVRGTIAPAEYQKDPKYWEGEWEKYYGGLYGFSKRFGADKSNPTVEDLKENSDELERRRRPWIIEKITFKELTSRRPELLIKFKKHLGDLYYEELRQSGKLAEPYKDFFESRPKLADEPNYSYEKFIKLQEALKISSLEFYQVKMEDLNPAEQEKNIEESFIRKKKIDLAQLALAQWKFLEIDNIKSHIEDSVPQLAGYLGQWTIYLFKFTVWFAMSLLLSFFITFDLPNITRGIQRLEQSRISEFYQEIAPGLAAFGALIGRAFQAQGIIALCNTLLTFALIKVLHIRYEVFLCSVVFICSFIPVLGVLISTVPISVIALQYNGFTTALLSIGGVLIIHFMETSILNPKILGEMLHLHPVLVLGILVVGEHFFKVWGLLLGVPVMVYIIRYVILGEDSIFPERVAGTVSRITGVSPPVKTAKDKNAPAKESSAQEPMPVGADETKID